MHWEFGVVVIVGVGAVADVVIDVVVVGGGGGVVVVGVVGVIVGVVDAVVGVVVGVIVVIGVVGGAVEDTLVVATGTVGLEGRMTARTTARVKQTIKHNPAAATILFLVVVQK